MTFDPTTEDARKLHQEVNQIMHERFLVTTVATTIFGLMIAWSLSKMPTIVQGQRVENLVYLVSIALIGILFALAWLHRSLRDYATVLTTYLRVFKLSRWEVHMEKFRKEEDYIGYAKPQTFLLVLLGGIATLYPIVLGWVYHLDYDPIGVLLTFMAGTSYMYSTWHYGFGKKRRLGLEAEDGWIKIRDTEPESGVAHSSPN